MILDLKGNNNEFDFPIGKTPVNTLKNIMVQKYKAVAEHLSCDFKGEAVILNMKNGRYYGINAVGVSIWVAIQTPVSFDDLQSAIMEEYQVDEPTCRHAVRSFLDKMAEEDLVVVVNENDS